MFAVFKACKSDSGNRYASQIQLMSIQLQNDGMVPAGAPGRAEALPQSQTSRNPNFAGSGSRAGDCVHISSLSQSVASANALHEATQASRVKRLASLYQSGHYSVDATLVGHAMISQVLTAGTGEES